MALDIDYRTLGPKSSTGGGQTLDISSTGVRFVGKHVLTTGAPVELTVYWPAKLEGAVPLQLRMFGTVVRVSGNQAALMVERHEFRTIKRSRIHLPWAPTE